MEVNGHVCTAGLMLRRKNFPLLGIEPQALGQLVGIIAAIRTEL
jgi:hypothetical protein